MKNYLWLLALCAPIAHAADRPIQLNQNLIEEIRVEGQIQAWKLYKICLDGAAYYVFPLPTAPTGIAPVYTKFGKPELCQGNQVKP
jgi:hypothetical protein